MGTQDVAQAICCAMRLAASLLHAEAIVCYTSSGNSSLRAARERPESPILSLSHDIGVSRKLALVWGVHSVHVNDPDDPSKLAKMAAEVALSEGFAHKGKPIVIIAGLPFGESGSTNLLRIAIV